MFVTGAIRRLQYPWLALVTLITVAGHAHASDLYPVDAESELHFTAEIDTVISATRIRQPLTESPSSVTVIDRNIIEASGAVEIADVLRFVPGIQVAYPQGNQLAVTYHGYGDAFPRDMQVLIDGRSIYQPSFGDIDWLFLGITLADIERIEVIRGPNTPFYGSNAVAGVINFITRLPLQDRSTLARATGGSIGTRHAVLKHGGRLGEVDYSLTLNHQENDGFPTDINSTNDDRELSGLSWRGMWNPRPSDEIDLQLGYTNGKLGGGAEPTTDPLPHDKSVTSHHQYISWRRAHDDHGEIRAQFYHNYYNSKDIFRDLVSHAFFGDDPAGPPTIDFLLAPNGGDQVAGFGLFDYTGERYDLEFQYTSPASERLQAVVGTGVRINRLNSPVLTDRQDWIDELTERIFANLTYKASRQLQVNAGIFAENSDEFGLHLSPRLNASWLLNTNNAVRASYTRARRNPSLVEGHVNVVNKLDDGTPYFIDLQTAGPDPETLTTIELGYVGYWLDRRLLVDFKLFREQTTGFIHEVQDCSVLQPIPVTPCVDVPPVSVYRNDGGYTVKGGELQLKYQTAPRDFISLQASLVETDNRANKRLNDPAEPVLLFFPNETVAPKYTTSLLASKSLGHGYEASAAAYWMDNMIWLGDGDRIKGYNRVDLRLARRWRSGGRIMLVEGIVQNVHDEYISFRDENFLDRRAYLRFSIEWL